MPITKLDFQTFRNCPSDFWIKKKKPELITKKEDSDFEKNLAKQGYEVEYIVQKMYKDGIVIDNTNGSGIRNTISAMSNRSAILFQPCFASSGLYAKVDMLMKNGDRWDLYEIKATSSKDKKREDHIYDVAFQKEVLENAGINLNKLHLIELNKDYKKNGELDLESLFVISDITDKVNNLLPSVKLEIFKAKKLLTTDEQPSSCDCIFKARNKQCESFDIFHTIPSYSVHDIAAIGKGKGKLESLIKNNIFLLDDVPDDFPLSLQQLNQVNTYKTKSSLIDYRSIKEELDLLIFPFYFLDYETVSYAIPKYDGTSPYQQVAFQYSLHILHEDGNVEHFEFLHADRNSPIDAMVTSLKTNIGSNGSIISWNKSFESVVNKYIAEYYTQHSAFLHDINNRMYDLMDIFGKKQFYVHHEFKGRYSIKNVLPVLCPDLSYKSLPINNGGMASTKWMYMIYECNEEKEIALLKQNLLEYCKLDTWAMVKIYQKLKNLYSEHEVEIRDFEDYLESKKLDDERNEKIKLNFNF